MPKARMQITIDERLKKEIKDEVGRGNVSQLIEKCLQRRIDSDGSIEDRLSGLRSKRHDLLSEIEEKQAELDELKDEINRIDREIERLEGEKCSKRERIREKADKFLEIVEDNLGESSGSAGHVSSVNLNDSSWSGPEDVPDYWVDELDASEEVLWRLARSHVSGDEDVKPGDVCSEVMNA